MRLGRRAPAVLRDDDVDDLVVRDVDDVRLVVPLGRDTAVALGEVERRGRVDPAVVVEEPGVGRRRAGRLLLGVLAFLLVREARRHDERQLAVRRRRRRDGLVLDVRAQPRRVDAEVE